ncbi:putative Ig domain-containing protein, partial [Flavobacterium sp.]|uniref:putative Ig domain-containing protein n=1 Tax=Flavobacterium sp. TaxID=239 RepID=UPI002639D10F
ATNSGGSTTFVVSIEVIDVAPSDLSYPTPNVFTINDAIANLSPTVTGGAILEYGISPALPTGLLFNTTTGIISGTPTVLSAATDYTVTATNSGGSTTFVVSIEVIEVMSIDEIKKPAFVLYPNPFEQVLHIKHNFDYVNYTLYSTDGKLIRKGILEGQQILMPDLPSGMYLLQLESDYSSQLFKIIKGIK